MKRILKISFLFTFSFISLLTTSAHLTDSNMTEMNANVEIKYTVYFFDDNGVIESSTILANDSLQLPELPEKEKYKSIGWRGEDNRLYYANDIVQITEDLTFTAEYELSEVLVVFTSEHQADLGLNQYVEVGQKLTLPTLQRDGYIFQGWENSGEIKTGIVTISKSESYHAQWKAIFKVSEGTITGFSDYVSSIGPIAAQALTTEQIYPTLKIPSKIDGVSMNGIANNAFTNHNFTNLIAPDIHIIGERAFRNSVLKEATLNPEVNVYPNAFESNDLNLSPSYYERAKFQEGNKVFRVYIEGEKPYPYIKVESKEFQDVYIDFSTYKANYVFVSWRETNGTNHYENTYTQITPGTTLSPIFEAIMFPFMFRAEQAEHFIVTGMPNITGSIQQAELFTLPAAPKQTGHTFLHWEYNGAPFNPGDQVAIYDNAVFTARWSKDIYTLKMNDNGGKKSYLTTDQQSVKGANQSNQTLQFVLADGGTLRDKGFKVGDKLTLEFEVRTDKQIPTAANRRIIAQLGSSWTELSQAITTTIPTSSGTRVKTITLTESDLNATLMHFRLDYIPTDVTVTFTKVNMYRSGKVPIGAIGIEAGPIESYYYVPYRSGYTFNGWYTAPTGGTRIDMSTHILISHMELYAQWTPIPKEVTITFKDIAGVTGGKGEPADWGVTNLVTTQIAGQPFNIPSFFTLNGNTYRVGLRSGDINGMVGCSATHFMGSDGKRYDYSSAAPSTNMTLTQYYTNEFNGKISASLSDCVK